VEYTLVGPPEALACLRAVAGVGEGGALPARLRNSALSPVSLVSLATVSEQMQRIGVPSGATSFAFSYPFSIDGATYDRMVAELGLDASAGNVPPAWFSFLVVGGFVYFDASGRILCANALSPIGERNQHPTHAAQELVLVGPYDAVPAAGDALRRAGRLQRVTLGSLQAAGFETFGWCYKSERPGGYALGQQHSQGAFVYRHSEGLYFFYQLWLPTLIEQAPEDKKCALDRAMRSEALRQASGGAAARKPRKSKAQALVNALDQGEQGPSRVAQLTDGLTEAERVELDELCVKYRVDLTSESGAGSLNEQMLSMVVDLILEKRVGSKGGGGRRAKGGGHVEVEVAGGAGCCVLQ
jgi:hypothetical protein